MKHNYPIIDEDEEEHAVMTSGGDTSQKRSNNRRSDKEVLQMYKRIVGDNSIDDPMPRLWQEEIDQDKVNDSIDSASPTNNIKQKPRKPEVGQGRNIQQKTFQISSRNPNVSLNEQKKFHPSKNTTNYSQGYKEAKPFSLKKQVRTNTVYMQETPFVPPSPETPAKQSTTESFIKRLHHNIVKDKGEQNSRVGKTMQHIKTEQKKLRDLIGSINNDQATLQERIREHHLQYKEYCREIYQKYSIDHNKEKIQSNKQILTLEPHRNSKELSKKTEVIQQYKLYTDKIQVEIRKFDYLLNLKKSMIEQQQRVIESSRLYKLLQEPIEEMEREAEEERPIVQGPTYKQIMKARRTKNYNKLNLLIGQNKQEQTIPKQPQTTKREPVHVYQTADGQIRVNQHLRNLLLQ